MMVDRKVLMCKLRFAGLKNWQLDDSNCLTYVGDISRLDIILPEEIEGLKEVGFSGLPLKSLTLGYNFHILSTASLANCTNLREIRLYEKQVNLLADIIKLYPNLVITIRKGVY